MACGFEMMEQGPQDYRALRLLLCVHQFFPQYSAGTEVLVLSTAKSLAKLGHEVQIVTGSITEDETAPHDSYEFAGFKVHRLWTPYQRGRISVGAMREEYYDERLVEGFDRVLAGFSPDIVHFFHLKNLTLACLQSCIDRRIPTVFTPTDYWLTCRACQLMKPWGKPECEGPQASAGNCMKHVVLNNLPPTAARLARLLPSRAYSLLGQVVPPQLGRNVRRYRHFVQALRYRKPLIDDFLSRVDLILPPTRSLERLALQSVNGDTRRVQLLRYAIEPPVLPKKGGTNTLQMKDGIVVGFIGTLVEHKGCRVLLEAVAQLPGVDIRVKIYGDRTHYPEFSRALEALASADERIQFLGTFEHDRIGEILAGLDVLVIPSTWRENAPLVLLNSLAAGTPVIASDVIGITEYLAEGDDVALFPAGNSEALAAALVRFLQRRGDHVSAGDRPGRVAGSSLPKYVTALNNAYARLIS